MQSVGSIINGDRKVGEKPVVDKNKCLTYQIQENTIGSCREKIKSDNPGSTIGDADKASKISSVSSFEQTRSNALSSTSTTVNNTEKDQKDQNDLDGRTTSVGSKRSVTVADNHKPNNE